jgi:beta-lactam-binding protein with PASTA domain
VADHSLGRASRRLRRAGFDVSVVRQYSNRLPPDVVLDQQPPAGREVVLPVGYRVRLVVSSNTPVTVGVPDVLGLPADAAVHAVRQSGFEPRVEHRCPGDTPTCTGAVERGGQVWEQSPEAGAASQTGAPVVMRVFPDATPR